MGQGRRTQPLPPDWEQLRRTVLARDGGRCHLCGELGATQVDHLTPAAEGGTDDLANLAAIHGECHASKSGREAARARARRYQTAHPREPHPGLTSNVPSPPVRKSLRKPRPIRRIDPPSPHH